MDLDTTVVTSSLWGWDWGTTADWFAGVATFAAVVVALIANRMTAAERAEAKTEREEAANDRAAYRRELELSQHERRADLARKILFTVEPRPQGDNRAEPSFHPDKGNRTVFRISNHSGFPIYDVKLGFADGLYGVTPFGSWDSLGPGESHVAEGVPPQGGLPTAAFLDVRGRGWLIDQHGILRIGNNRIDFLKLQDGADDVWPDPPRS